LLIESFFFIKEYKSENKLDSYFSYP